MLLLFDEGVIVMMQVIVCLEEFLGEGLDACE